MRAYVGRAWVQLTKREWAIDNAFVESSAIFSNSSNRPNDLTPHSWLKWKASCEWAVAIHFMKSTHEKAPFNPFHRNPPMTMRRLIFNREINQWECAGGERDATQLDGACRHCVRGQWGSHPVHLQHLYHHGWGEILNKYPPLNYLLNLLFGEMDPAQIRLIQKIFIKRRGAAFF
jgi:hypothetical protein